MYYVIGKRYIDTRRHLTCSFAKAQTYGGKVQFFYAESAAQHTV